MKQVEDYEFEVSLSQENFENKEISGAMIGSIKEPKNRKIRKEYGYKRGVSFKRELVSSETLLNSLLDGHVFCHLFTPEQVRKDQTFGSSQKTDVNFSGSYVIGVDVDKTQYTSIDTYINQLSLQPTFFYTTYSHLKEGKGLRFRLIYVFDTKIDNPYKFRYCAKILNNKIERETQEVMDDDCNLRCTQYFNGTNRNNPDVKIEYGISNCIYTLDDLGYNQADYIQFLSNYCHYKSYNREKVELMGNILIEETDQNWRFDRSNLKFIPLTSDDNIEVIFQTFENRNLIDNEDYSPSLLTILNDWSRLDKEEFIRCSEWIEQLNHTKYVYRVEKEWIDDTYQFVDDDYFSLFWNIKTIRDGNKRRKNLYTRMCLRRIMKPDITKNELVVNTIIDIIRDYDNSDGLLGQEFIIKNVDTCFDQPVDVLKINYHSQIEYLKRYTRPKRGIIYKNKKCHTKETSFLILDEYYNPRLSVKENHQILNDELRYKVSKTLLYEYVKDRGIGTDPHKLTDDELKNIIDVNLSVRENLKILKDNQIKCSMERVHWLLNDKKGEELLVKPAIEVKRRTKSNVLNQRKDPRYKPQEGIEPEMTFEEACDFFMSMVG